jgi:predicted extracellular nuclease
MDKLKSKVFYFLLFTLLFSGCKTTISKQNQNNKSEEIYTIAFYNLENLFDTINDPNKNDEDFLPSGKYKWNSDKYLKKQDSIAKIISKLGRKKSKNAPSIVGLCEIENKQVVEDLINRKGLKEHSYGVVQIEGPDKRGIDVALIYRKDHFKYEKASARELWFNNTYEGFATRNQLIVEGEIAGEKIALIVNHWPSRRSDSRYREEAAKLNRSIIDSLRRINHELHIITMGDLNDDPTDASVIKELNAGGLEDVKSKKKDLFNPMYDLFKDGKGTLAYRGKWNLFDQIILTPEFLSENNQLKFVKAEICEIPELINSSGRYKGYPFRSFVAGRYIGGYSDHLPVVIYLTK